MACDAYKDTFKGTAYYYSRFRPGYPKEFFDLVIHTFALDGTGRLLDLGCGTGQIAVPLAPYFSEAIAMDPEPEMLEEAERAIRQAGLRNVSLIEGSSSDLLRLSDRLGTLRLVTMGSSFHWMDRRTTLYTLSQMVEPGGGVVVVSGGSLWTKDQRWCRAVRATVQRWLGEERRAGGSTYAVAEERHQALIDQSAFGPCKVHSIRYEREWTVEELCGYLYSTSFCSPYVLGHRRQSFEDDLRETLLRLNPAGRFIEQGTFEVLIGILPKR